MPRPRSSAHPSRVVFDTNIVVSALFLSKGRLALLRDIWRQGIAVPLVSRATTEELLHVLAYPKFKLSEGDQQELLECFLPFAEVVVVPQPPPKTPRCRDPKDVPFVELALAAKADALVTGDADLLVLSDKLPVAVMRAEEWIAALNASPGLPGAGA